MPTRPGQSKALLDQLLASQDPVAVEASIARLAIIGRPALRLVLDQLETADAAHLPRLLGVIERIGAPAALPGVRRFLAHEAAEVAGAAVDAVGALLDAPDDGVAARALDALTAVLLDTARPDALRLRAFEAIAGAQVPSDTYDADVVEPLRASMRVDPSSALRAAAEADVAVQAPPAPAGPSPDMLLDADASLPDADTLRQAIVAGGPTAPLASLHRAIERIRSHEAQVPAAEVEAWRVARAAAHQALAARGSRLAVYDLRESLEALGEHTPVGMLSALQQVGDASVLEPIADAWQRAGNPWFRSQLATIFRAVATRERVTRRQAAMKKLAARLPEASAAMWS